MASQLIQVLEFTNVPVSGSSAQAHNINLEGLQVKPDFVAFTAAGFSAVVTDTTCTVTNNGEDTASCFVWLERKHSSQRAFGGVQNTNLVPQPFYSVAGGGGSGGGGETTVFTFLPGGGGGPPFVFADFDDLYAALAAVRATQSGFFTIVFNDTFEPCVIPGNAYNMEGVSWVGANGPALLDLVTVTITNEAAITNLMSICGLNLFKEDVSGTPPIIVNSNGILAIEASTITGGNCGSAGAEVISLPVPMAGNCALRIGPQTTLNGGALLIAPNNTIVMYLNGGAISSGAIGGDATTGVNLQVVDAAVQLVSQGAMAGTILIYQSVPVWWWNQGDPNLLVQAEQGFRLIDTSTGDEYKCAGGPTWAIVP